MDSQQRREQILNILATSPDKPVNGTKLAKACEVSRQIIVGDIAILRARGHEILSTPRGYRLADAQKHGLQRIFVCRHNADEMQAELNAIVDNGGIVHNVVIEHDVYGALEGTLDLHSRRDVKNYVQKMQASHAPLLSSISDGIHTHLVEAERKEDLDAIENALKKLGFLYQE